MFLPSQPKFARGDAAICLVVAGLVTFMIQPVPGAAFNPAPVGQRPNNLNLPNPTKPIISSLLNMADGDFGLPEKDDFDADDDDDDVSIDPDSLGDWRAFRRNLAQSGIGVSESSSESAEGGSKEKKPEAKPKSVSKRNEELLMSQNKALANEYRTGVWAHEAPNAEVGGLLCRLPLEAEIYRNTEHSLIGKKLETRLSLDNGDLPSEYYGDDVASGDDGTGTQASEPLPMGASSPGVSFSPLAAQTVFWYRNAQSLIKSEITKVTALAQDGQIDASQLSPEGSDMLNLYLDHQNTWQEVCLVLDRNEKIGISNTVVLNRPMAFKATENLARLALFGAFGVTNDDSSTQSKQLERFLMAFKSEIGLYVGGPDMMDRPAIMVHGIAGLEGATEISPGIGMYRGGLEAAVTGILQGQYKPLDFRFFVGRHRYDKGELDLAVHLGKYQPVACARSLALKQCIALPKPLWHEVMELCGGELKEISSLELMKRDDIQGDRADD